MADIVPYQASDDAVYGARRSTVFFDAPGSDPATLLSLENVSAMKQLTYYFADADDTELFAPPRGTVACAWQANEVGDTTSATLSSTGIIFSSGSNDKGWLHCLTRGSNATGTTTTQAPVSRGTDGYVDPARGIYLNDKHATPDTLTNASAECRIATKLGMKLRIFPFTIPNASDRWKSQSTGLCQGIVAVAWQANSTAAADRVAVTLDAAGDVIFTSAGGADPGWLWVWSR